MRRRLRFERLECRRLLAADFWIGGNGNWTDAAHWSSGVPSASSDVTIDTATAATITIQPGEVDAVNSLTLGANNTLFLPGGGDPTNPTTNLLSGNAGFESPTTTGSTTRAGTWGAWGSSYLSTQYAYTGSQSLVISGQNSGVSQAFTVTPGAGYTLSVYAMSPAGNPLSGNIGGEIQLLFFDSSGTQLSSFSPPNQIVVLNGSSATGGPLAGSVGNQGWNHFSTTVTAPATAATVRVQMATYSGGGTFGGAVYFDAVKFGPAATGPSQLTSGSLTNNGTIIVGPTNKITVSGAFTQSSTGALDVQLGGAPSTNVAGAMAVAGAATLGGTFKSELLYGYTPSTTDSFTTVTYASETGTFASYVLPSGAGYTIAAAPSFTNVLVSAAPTAAVTTTVNAATILHPVATNLLGINSTWWDSAAVSSQTQQMAMAAGFKLYRFPGGSSSDEYHFNISNNFNDSVAITLPQFAKFIEAAGGTGLATLDYGSDSPQEAAAELAYLEGSTGDATVIGSGIEWSTTANQWQTVDWKTVAYWAGLRAATPLAQNDGLNFLRIGHAAPFSSVKHWEIGNEEYGSWETDHHGTPGPGGASTGAQHDPATYAAFAKQFTSLATTILANAGLPAPLVGIDSGDPTGGGDNNWTKNVLTAGAGIGFVPAFISDHSYMQGPNNESDSFLLNKTVSYAPSIFDWSTRYAAYQSLLQQTVGAQAASVQLMATEFNSVYTSPGKQSTSLVNGLFIANSLGSLLTSGYVAGTAWDLRNGWDSGNNNSPALYGWRMGGDYGVLGSSGVSAPASGTYIAYPNYFAMQLFSKIATAGAQVVSAVSAYGNLNVYTAMQVNGNLSLLVINTNPAAAITSQFNLTGFQPAGTAVVWQYGKTQDTAQSQSANGAAALANSNANLSLNGSNFSYTFPAYSMTVLEVKVAQALTSIAVSLSANNLSTAGTEQFTATARDQFSNPMASQPTFSWSVTGGGQIDASGLFKPAYTSGTATIQASAGGMTGTMNVTLPGAASWTAGGASSSWNASGNWQSSALGGNLALLGLRGVTGDTALFQTAPSTTVSLNGSSPTLAGITFNNGAATYAIAPGSGGALQMSNGGANATIQVAAGNHGIQSPVTLVSNLSIDTAAASSLTISGGVSGSGKSLVKTGAGTLTLSGANTFTGGTTVSGGSLVVKNGASLGGSLVIGNGALVTLAASDANGNSLADASDSASFSLPTSATGSAQAIAAVSVDSGSAPRNSQLAAASIAPALTSAMPAAQNDSKSPAARFDDATLSAPKAAHGAALSAAFQHFVAASRSARRKPLISQTDHAMADQLETDADLTSSPLRSRA